LATSSERSEHGSPYAVAGSIQRCLIIQGIITVEKVAVLSLLLVATTLEAGGDAVVRVGLNQHAIGVRMLVLLLGGIMLFCYGVVLNQAPFDFGRLIGAYVATFFLVGQVINLVAFRTSPSVPVILGGLLIIAGGGIITVSVRPA
jgi:drug/metabolite transporter superfamily protein YnfA